MRMTVVVLTREEVTVLGSIQVMYYLLLLLVVWRMEASQSGRLQEMVQKVQKLVILLQRKSKPFMLLTEVSKRYTCQNTQSVLMMMLNAVWQHVTVFYPARTFP